MRKEFAVEHAEAAELLKVNQRLLDCIAAGDWATYVELCDPSLTAFEPEAHACLVEGLEFHQFYFKLGGARRQHNTTICAPSARVIGDVGVVAFTRLNQRIGADGSPYTQAFLETRIWQRQEGKWKHIHFHRSLAGG